MMSRLPLRFLMFSIVGLTGIGVNMLVLWAVTEHMGIPYQLASLLAIQIAIMNNYIWNLKFTWRDRDIHGSHEVARTFARFTLVSWVAGALNWFVLIGLTELFQVYYLMANMIAILLAALLNYFVNDSWTFRRRSSF